MLHTAQRYSTAIQQINYPVHQGRPNPIHGKFMFVGSIPAACWNAEKNNGPFSPKGGSKYYDTEAAAILAAADAGAEYIQGADCRRVTAEEIAALRAAQ